MKKGKVMRNAGSKKPHVKTGVASAENTHLGLIKTMIRRTFPTPHIKITRKMVEAGADIIWEFDPRWTDVAAMARAVYRAMKVLEPK